MSLEFGISYKLENVPITWHLTLDNLQKWEIAISNPSNEIFDIDGNTTKEDITFFDNAFRHLSIGAELFAESAFILRLGYNFRRAAELRILELRNFSGLSFGIGMQLRRLRFQISHARYNVAGNRTFLGLTLEPRR